ncbi:hypothetical protein [Nocardioides piscis]|uniref:Uncharacterized protein n=1 Tax=Nocardioides piscis TaxID=2714938 RepID=A0A6G7YGB7_9ACTN|nr:hypothetical protein [Nocardioides piscis]QIK75820.1 hypothetical protein G7071_10570 [Nocardioides piscis]
MVIGDLGQDIGNLLAVVALLISGHGYFKDSHRAALVWALSYGPARE